MKYRNFLSLHSIIQFILFLFDSDAEYERNYDPEGLSLWMKANNWIPIAACTLYALFIYFGPKYMEKREAFDLRVS